MNQIYRKNLSKFLGVDASELINVYISNKTPIKEISEETIGLTFEDNESSNNSNEQNQDNNTEYKSHYDLRILYDSWDEYENLREDFREFIPELLQNTDGMRNIFLFSENDDIRNKSPIEDDFNNALRKLVKFKNEPWVNEISRIIINALRGVYTTLNLMKLPLTEDESDELYRELAYGLIINIVLETRENMGECEMNRMCYFKCAKCNKETTYLFNEKDNNDVCSICWNDNT